MKSFSDNGRGFFASCLFSQLYFIGSAVLLLLIFCAVSVSLDDPDRVTPTLSLVSLYLSAFVSGIAAVRLSGDGLASGAVSGLFTATMVMLLSFLPFPSSGYDSLTSLLCCLLTVPAATLGAVIGHKKTKKPLTHAKKAYPKKYQPKKIRT